MNPLRPVILAAAGSARLRRTITRVPLTAAVVRRFVAGETRTELLPVVRELLGSGRMVSVDFLGEYTDQRAMADAAVTEYLALIDDLAVLSRDKTGDPVAAGPVGAVPVVGLTANSVRRVEVSVKLSALGQALSPDGPQIATANLVTLCRRAEQAGVWVTVDAEDHTTADTTLATVRELRAEFPWLAVAAQTYLRRTTADCRDAAAAGARIRLCKGAYREPEQVAYQRRGEVDDSYLRCLDALMCGGGYPMVASHDPAMLTAAERLATETGRGPGDFEFQMLYGIRDGEQRRLVSAGHGMRVYVPYGNQWYGYLMRRLAERPANLGFFLRALAERNRATR